MPVADLPPKLPIMCMRPIGDAFGTEGEFILNAARDAAIHWKNRAEWILNAQKQRESLQIAEHMNFLDRVSTQGDPPLITPETAALARLAWINIRDVSGGAMPIPAACAGPDGKVSYTWDNGLHHLELDIIPHEPAQFFYFHRSTEETWESEHDFGMNSNGFSPPTLQHLKLFT